MPVELRPFGVACNIACHYCYQNPQREAGNFRQPYDLPAMKAAVERQGGPFTLFGGEPLLLPLSDLEELFRWGMEKYGLSTIQTNGILITDAHIRLFNTYNVDVGISIDGPDELNDLRWHADLERTRRDTKLTLANIERLCREHRPPGLIVTLHRGNATAAKLSRLHAWIRQLDALGVCSVRLHLLEVESAVIRQAYGLSDEENVRALLSFADLQSELTQLRFDVLTEMEQSLLGRDQQSSCVWHACDPYTTEAVRGVEGNGQSSNCGRTNKDGIDFLKADRPGFERYLALYHTPQTHGGCQGCRFFLMCKGQCPGTAIDGDWRNRSELCGVWQRIFIHLEKKLILQDEAPLSIHPLRHRLESHLLARWANGRNDPIHALPWTQPAPSAEPQTQAGFTLADKSHQRPFVRHTFVGETQRATWALRFDRVRAALAHISVLSVAARLTSSAVVVVAPAEVFPVHNLAASYGLHTLPLAHAWGELIIIADEDSIADYRRADAQGAARLLDELTGMPACCRRANAHFRAAGYGDPVWHIAAREQATDAAIDVRCPPGVNFLLRPLGIDPLSYLPCAFTCAASQALSSARLALGRDAGLGEAVDWLEAMLAWPAEWSALHGIAELKTGIVKFAYNTDYTLDKLTVRYHGQRLAPDAARGLSFIYKDPRAGRHEISRQEQQSARYRAE